MNPQTDAATDALRRVFPDLGMPGKNWHVHFPNWVDKLEQLPKEDVTYSVELELSGEKHTGVKLGIYEEDGVNFIVTCHRTAKSEEGHLLRFRAWGPDPVKLVEGVKLKITPKDRPKAEPVIETAEEPTADPSTEQVG